MKKYIQYSVEDFVLDDGFRTWVLNESPRNDVFWREWITRHPGMQPVINEARQIILGLQAQKAEVSKEEIDAGYREVEAYFDKAMQRESRWIGKGFWRIAAAVLALVVAGLGILFQNQPQDEVKQYITEAGEHEKIELPDGSRVYMKENSRLSYATDWSEVQQRKVKLEGEAYFQVREQLYHGNKVKFIVEANDISVEVVGTEFVVNNRTSKTQVALNSGKIRLTLEQNNEVLNMLPGDVVEYDATNNQLLSHRKDIGPSDSWLNTFEKSTQAGSEKTSDSRESQNVTRGSHIGAEEAEEEVSGKSQTQQGAPSIDTWTDVREESRGASQSGEDGSIIPSSPAASYKQGGSMSSSGGHYILQPEDPDRDQATGNVGEVSQQGNNNTAYIEQIGEGLSSKQDQHGNQNEAEATISGNSDANDDLGWSSWQQQHGSGNVSIFNIVESYNTNMYSQQHGKENSTDVYSEGEHNLGSIMQYGKQNYVIITQDGNQNEALIHQSGQGNEVTGMDPLAPGVLQEGRFNEVQIIQHGSNNQSQNIQRGQNNDITVNQNGN